MAQTTTARNACDAVIFLDNALGIPVNISGSSNTINMDVANNTGGARTFGSQWTIMLTCGSEITFGITALYSTSSVEARELFAAWQYGTGALPGGMAGTPGTPRTLRIAIPDNLPGSEQFELEAVLEKHTTTIDSSAPEPMTIEISLKNSGAVVRTIIV